MAPYVILPFSKFTWKSLSSHFFKPLNSKGILVHAISLILSRDHSQTLPSQIKWENYEIPILSILLQELYLPFTSQMSPIQHSFSLIETSISMSFTSSIVVLLPLSLHVFHILNCFNILISLASPSPYDKRTLKRKRERGKKTTTLNGPYHLFSLNLKSKTLWGNSLNQPI